MNIEALPLEVPQHLEIDVSELRIGDTLRLSELAVPAGVTLLDDPEETVIATVVHPSAPRKSSPRSRKTPRLRRASSPRRAAEAAEAEDGDGETEPEG